MAQLEKHLALLQRLQYITFWADKDIRPGTEWEHELAVRLDEAQVILLLISASFLASDYCYGKEMQKAMARHQRGEAYVIPVIVRPVVWQDAPFGKLQALPKNAEPIATWHNQDEAFMNVAEGVSQVVKEVLEREQVSDRWPADLHKKREPGEQEKVSEELDIEQLDPKVVWKRIQRKDIPSPWHVIEGSVSSGIGKGILAGGVWGFCAGVGLEALGVEPLYAAMHNISLPTSTVADYPNALLLGTILCGTLLGVLLGGAWGRTHWGNRLVLMPDGLIHFDGKDPHIVSYKVIRNIHFDPSNGNYLVCDPLPLTNDPEIARLSSLGRLSIDGYNEAPHLITQCVREAYASFQACRPAVKLSTNDQLATITYQGPLAVSADSMIMHWGYNNWNGTTDTFMTRAHANTWQAIIAIPPSATELNMTFSNERNTWDNHDGLDYNLSVSSS
ncbi:MAG: TIR domain-containing protein [Ktedonobacteraceae bacterium]|nr:TIR domain-containing protein [Ktedonobacteraceae bacterium]